MSGGPPGGFTGPAVLLGISLSAKDKPAFFRAIVRLGSLPAAVLAKGAASMLDRIRHALAGSLRRRSRVLLVIVDIDNFHGITDNLGPAGGEEALRTVAARLSQAMRPSDTVARFGADEFAMLCHDVSNEGAAMELADRVQAALAPPVRLGEGQHVLSASIGLALDDKAIGDADALVRNAVTALHRAKAAGPAHNELFDKAMHTRAAEQWNVEHALRRALEDDQWLLAYQPIVSLSDGRVRAMEALLRWDAPGRGLVLPGEFMSVAENSGLIVPIGAWVFQEACRQVVIWRKENPTEDALRVQVNVAASQLAQVDLYQHIASALADTGLEPSALGVEITESALMEDSRVPIETLRQLKTLGVHISLDDFGTGYSSLGYLQRFPVDTLKLDRTFVARLGEDPGGTAFISAIVEMAKALGLEVAAEGVETGEQASAVHELGCHLAQGYYFARPLAAADAGALQHAALADMRAFPRTRF